MSGSPRVMQQREVKARGGMPTATWTDAFALKSVEEQCVALTTEAPVALARPRRIVGAACGALHKC